LTFHFELKPNSYKFQPTINQLQIAKTTYTNNGAQFVLKNNTNFDLVVPVDKPLVSALQLKNMTSIPEEEYMDEKELNQANDSLLESGFFQPSLTSFIESRYECL